MNLPLVRFTIRRLMLAILAIALPCAWIARRLHWRDPLVEARAQYQMAMAVGVDIGRFMGPHRLLGPGDSATGRGASGEPSPGRHLWRRAYFGERSGGGALLFDVEATGGCDATGLEPIVIEDRGGLNSAELV